MVINHTNVTSSLEDGLPRGQGRDLLLSETAFYRHHVVVTACDDKVLCGVLVDLTLHISLESVSFTGQEVRLKFGYQLPWEF